MTVDTDAASPSGSLPGGKAIGDVLAGRYRIDALIGTGGMSSVFRAVDTSLGRTVALKLFRPELAGADDLRRQKEEVRLLASLNHPTLVTLHDAVADEDGRAFLVLEFIEGRDLRAVIDAGPLAPATVADVGADIADALAWVHDRGIVHRDVKPGNVLIPDRPAGGRGPRAKLADFGIARLIDDARLTTTGSIVGTASYLSPEQAAGQPVGPPSDLYALGLVLLEALTGERPFGGSGIESLLARLNRDPVIPATLGRDWVRLLRALTARAPGERLTAPEAADRLGVLARDPGGAAARDSTEDRTLRYPVAQQFTDGDQTAALPSSVDGWTESGEGDATASPPASAEEEETVALPLRTAETAVQTSAAPVLEPAVSARRPARSRRRVIVAASAALLVALAVVAAILFVSTLPGAESQPDYPAVEGELGDHLEQLQRSVDR